MSRCLLELAVGASSCAPAARRAGWHLWLAAVDWGTADPCPTPGPPVSPANVEPRALERIAARRPGRDILDAHAYRKVLYWARLHTDWPSAGEDCKISRQHSHCRKARHKSKHRACPKAPRPTQNISFMVCAGTFYFFRAAAFRHASLHRASVFATVPVFFHLSVSPINVCLQKRP